MDNDWNKLRVARGGGNYKLVEKAALYTRDVNELARRARKLRELHKRVKAGLVKVEDLTVEQKRLLEVYYGY